MVGSSITIGGSGEGFSASVMVSPLEGAHGNVEFLAHLRRGARNSAGVPDLAGIVAEASARQGR